MSFSLLFASFGQAQAAMISNSQLINQAQQSNEKTTLLQTIRRADVQSQLLSMGVNTADIEKRVDQMTQAEVAQLNQQIDQLPAGSGVLGIVVLIFIVFVITDVIGATDIFPFIHPVR
jgi:uncharacterized phage infection (PIP) family protein YhgE